MAKIVEYREIPLGNLIISKGQARTRDVGKGIDELAESIAKQGLLQPIVVCESDPPGKWEILTGQRRFLAHQKLGKDTITAGILDKRVDEAEAKAISITENLIRRALSGQELIDGITFLYNWYGGNAAAVVRKTGFSPGYVRDYVKFPRLNKRLQEEVKSGEVDVKVALNAQDAAYVGHGRDDAPSEALIEESVKLAREMKSMSGVQQKKLVQEREASPETTVDDAIEQARTSSKITQVTVTLTGDAHAALKRFAKDRYPNQDEAAADLIEEALKARGLLGE